MFTFKPKFAAGRGGGVGGRFVWYTHDALSKILGTGSRHTKSALRQPQGRKRTWWVSCKNNSQCKEQEQYTPIYSSYCAFWVKFWRYTSLQLQCTCGLQCEYVRLSAIILVSINPCEHIAVWAFIGVGIFPVSIHDSGVLSVRNCRVGFCHGTDNIYIYIYIYKGL
jgi:hypothetical protein